LAAFWRTTLLRNRIDSVGGLEASAESEDENVKLRFR
jgi:hypothetical protein